MYTDLADSNLKILDLQSQTTTVLTSDPGTETAPVWSSDGKRVYYRSDSGGVFYKEVDGTSPSGEDLRRADQWADAVP